MTQKPTTPCLEWQGSVSKAGYGTMYVKGKNCQAHELSWRLANHGRPLRLYRQELDHLCRNTRCIRPDHLEPVSMVENILRGFGPTAVNARKQHCINGHPLKGRNLLRRKNGNRGCWACQRMLCAAWNKRNPGYYREYRLRNREKIRKYNRERARLRRAGR